MAVLRFLCALFFLVALVAFAADATPWLSGQLGIPATSAVQRWGEIAPSSLRATQDYLSAAGAGWIWGAIIAPLLSVPASLLFGVLALLSGYAGRRRRRINVFVN